MFGVRFLVQNGSMALVWSGKRTAYWAPRKETEEALTRLCSWVQKKPQYIRYLFVSSCGLPLPACAARPACSTTQASSKQSLAA
jgi:hypothetical protein